jgi:hypothetical protein
LFNFHRPDLDTPGGDFFTVTSSEPVTIQRTGDVFSPEDQRRIFSEGATAFYITLTWHNFVTFGYVRLASASSLFVHGIGNKLTFYGVALGLALVVFFSYVPGVQSFVGSATVGIFLWVCAVVTGAVLWVYNYGSF